MSFDTSLIHCTHGIKTVQEMERPCTLPQQQTPCSCCHKGKVVHVLSPLLGQKQAPLLSNSVSDWF